MINNSYNKNSLEAVTQGSNRLVVILRDTLCKTTLFLLLTNNTFAQSFIDEIKTGIDHINEYNVNYKNQRIESGEEASLRAEKEKTEMDDVKLNKAEVADSRYYVNKQWVSTKYTKPFRVEDLKDSDGDGYDDYTEFINGTNPKDANSFPAIRNGNNKKIFK
jgi:hypothetical protein